MDDLKNNNEHVKETDLERASNILNYCIFVFIISIISYFIGLLYNNFDFSLIFEAISFILIFMTKSRIKNGDIQMAKLCIIIAILPIIFLLGFDLINLLLNFGEVSSEVFHYFTSFDQVFYVIEPYIVDTTLIINIVLMFKAFTSLKHAEGSIEKTYTDNFYDSL